MGGAFASSVRTNRSIRSSTSRGSCASSLSTTTNRARLTPRDDQTPPPAVRLGSLELSPRRPLDGAMGTELLGRTWTAAGMPALARWSAEDPDLVRAVHHAYAAAGAQLLTTN